MKIEIDDSMIPEGYEPIGYGKPEKGALFLGQITGKAIEKSLKKNIGNRILLQKKRWKPEIGRCYYVVNLDCEVTRCVWGDHRVDLGRYNSGNCYSTREEAEQAAERVRKAYLGD